MYLFGYGAGRFWIESLRIDPAHSIGGLRVNQWVALVAAVVSATVLVIDWRRHRGAGAARPAGLAGHDNDEDTPDSSPLASKPVSDRISPQVVAKVARLARLDLSEAEIERTTVQLAGMLEHFADIDSLQLDSVEPMNQPYPLQNVLRDDVVQPGLDRDEVLAEAPEAEDGRFRVPPIIGLEA
jgi:aspartyl-tRNA(Asn)/glutamyl-tRNA(Gln) amidotransferase subunit C